jgi:Domain of unknown function (DUF4252)
MMNRTLVSLFACVTLTVLMGCGAHAAPLDMPSFAHLRSKAIESVDVSIGAFPLFIARCVMPDSDPDSAEVKAMLKGLKGVYVRSYKFDEDFVYSKEDVEAVRTQLTKPGWSSLAQVRDRKQNEDVDVYVSIKDDKITRLAVIVTEPRELTIVYIDGTIDPAQLQKFSDGQFQLPGLPQREG